MPGLLGANFQIIPIDLGQFFSRALEAWFRSLDAVCRISRGKMLSAQTKGLPVAKIKPLCGHRSRIALEHLFVTEPRAD